PSQRPLRILVVEDHQGMRGALQKWLLDLGHEVEAVDTIANAHRYAKRFTFDILISDISLPDGDGRELLRVLREDHDFQSVAITARTGRYEHEMSLLAGFDQHLQKPFNFEELSDVLSRATAKLWA